MQPGSTDARRRKVKEIMSNAALATKKCYFVGCDQPTIKAHSISNKRLLLKLAENGMVMHKSKVSETLGELVETGRGAATVFRGFCGNHDKIFLPIDNEDYIPGNAEQEFLFAFRAAAHEFSAKSAAQHAVEAVASEHGIADPARLSMVEQFIMAHRVGLQDQEVTRRIFIDTFGKSKHNVIETAVIIADEMLPMAVNSSFNLELDPDGNLINDHSETEEALSKAMKPCFLNVFPQNGKTYCLLSYWHRNRKDYAFTQTLNDMSETDKQVLISNLIATYTENFVANPTFWKSFTVRREWQYLEIFGSTFKQYHAPLVIDETFNLFPSAQPF